MILQFFCLAIFSRANQVPNEAFDIFIPMVGQYEGWPGKLFPHLFPVIRRLKRPWDRISGHRSQLQKMQSYGYFPGTPVPQIHTSQMVGDKMILGKHGNRINFSHYPLFDHTFQFKSEARCLSGRNVLPLRKDGVLPIYQEMLSRKQSVRP